MKAVPINHDGDFRKCRLLFPKGVCVGCAEKTDKLVETRDWGYSNTYFRVISFPMCDACVEVERERQKLRKEIDAILNDTLWKVILPSTVVGGLLGFCLPIALLQSFGWGVVIAVSAVGLLSGAVAGLVLRGCY